MRLYFYPVPLQFSLFASFMNLPVADEYECCRRKRSDSLAAAEELPDFFFMKSALKSCRIYSYSERTVCCRETSSIGWESEAVSFFLGYTKEGRL